MKFTELLPIGSVVLLKDAKKKIVIMGIMQMKQMETGDTVVYEYMGVPYPEGYLGQETGLLFNHQDIKEIVFKGYINEERDYFVDVIEKIVDNSSSVIEAGQ